MGTIKIIYDKKNCIGAAECEVLSKTLWKVNNAGKADLAGSILNENTGKYELEIDESEMKEQQNVANACPSGCIRVVRE